MRRDRGRFGSHEIAATRFNRAVRPLSRQRAGVSVIDCALIVLALFVALMLAKSASSHPRPEGRELKGQRGLQ
jgi:hypothetical protein